MMLPSERLMEAAARDPGHQWVKLAHMDVCENCGVDRQHPDAGEPCQPIHPRPDIEAMRFVEGRK